MNFFESAYQLGIYHADDTDLDDYDVVLIVTGKKIHELGDDEFAQDICRWFVRGQESADST